MPYLSFILNYWKQILAVAIIIAAYLFGHHNANQAWENKIQKEQLQALEQQKIKQAEFDSEKSHIASQFEEWRRTHPEVKYVKEYITDTSNRNCSIPAGFVLLHEKALNRIDPYGGSKSNDEPTGIDLSTVAETISHNYNVCLTEIQKLKALQETVRIFQEKQKQ